jgi:hypothetical protein
MNIREAGLKVFGVQNRERRTDRGFSDLNSLPSPFRKQQTDKYTDIRHDVIALNRMRPVEV